MLEDINRQFGVDIKKSSFHPLVSKMASDGILARDGQKVALAERVKKEEVPETETAAP